MITYDKWDFGDHSAKGIAPLNPVDEAGLRALAATVAGLSRGRFGGRTGYPAWELFAINRPARDGRDVGRLRRRKTALAVPSFNHGGRTPNPTTRE